MPSGFAGSCFIIVGTFAFITDSFAHVVDFFNNLRGCTGGIEVISLLTGIIGVVAVAGAAGSGIGTFGEGTVLIIGKKPQPGFLIRLFRNSKGGVVCV